MDFIPGRFGPKRHGLDFFGMESPLSGIREFVKSFEGRVQMVAPGVRWGGKLGWIYDPFFFCWGLLIKPGQPTSLVVKRCHALIFFEKGF